VKTFFLHMLVGRTRFSVGAVNMIKHRPVVYLEFCGIRGSWTYCPSPTKDTPACSL